MPAVLTLGKNRKPETGSRRDVCENLTYILPPIGGAVVFLQLGDALKVPVSAKLSQVRAGFPIFHLLAEGQLADRIATHFVIFRAWEVRAGRAICFAGHFR